MTEPQHMTALGLANASRKARTAIRHQVYDTHRFEDSCAELAEVFATGTPACMAGMRVEEALRWLYYHGRRSDRLINHVLDNVGCTEWKLVGDLTVRQRSVLVNVLRCLSTERLAA